MLNKELHHYSRFFFFFLVFVLGSPGFAGGFCRPANVMIALAWFPVVEPDVEVATPVRNV